MADIVERLRVRRYSRTGDTELITLEAAAEIERLRAGGCARDQGTTQYCAEATKLAAENERLRAALKNIRELNFTSDGWAHSDMIEQEIVFALAQGGKDE